MGCHQPLVDECVCHKSGLIIVRSSIQTTAKTGRSHVTGILAVESITLSTFYPLCTPSKLRCVKPRAGLNRLLGSHFPFVGSLYLSLICSHEGVLFRTCYDNTTSSVLLRFISARDYLSVPDTFFCIPLDMHTLPARLRLSCVKLQYHVSLCKWLLQLWTADAVHKVLSRECMPDKYR